jgi:hypothetical protein
VASTQENSGTLCGLASPTILATGTMMAPRLSHYYVGNETNGSNKDAKIIRLLVVTLTFIAKF